MRKRDFFTGVIATLIVFSAGYFFQVKSIKSVENKVYAAPRTTNLVTLPDFAGIAELLNPAVVLIKTTSVQKQVSPHALMGDDDFFQYFFGPQFKRQAPKERKSVGWGSGVFISHDGYIITNNHVVENAEEITVTLNDEREFDAEVIGTDPEIDIALIKIKGKDFPMAELGDSEKLKVGQWVVAIGNPLGYDHSVTAGIVSAKGRRLGTGVQSFIQTDAAINFGNSGGPLVDLKGNIVGINTAISSRGQNIGFSVPINMVKDILADLKDKGKVSRGALGVTVSKLSKVDKKAFKVKYGALVQESHEDMAAYKAGIRDYDVIVDINGEKVKDRDDLIRKISSLRAGNKVKITVVRDGVQKNFTVVLDSREEFNNDKDLEKNKEDKNEPTSLSEKLGFSITNLNNRIRYNLRISEDIEGVIVDSVDEMSKAFDLGLRKGAVITEVNRKPISSVKDFLAIVKPLGKDDVVIFKILERGGSRIITLEVN